MQFCYRRHVQAGEMFKNYEERGDKFKELVNCL